MTDDRGLADDPQVTTEDDRTEQPYERLEFKTKEEKDAHYNNIYKEREKRLRAKAVSDLLEKLEVEDEDELEEALSDYRVIQEAATTETQVLEEKTQKAEKQNKSLKENLQATEAERDSAAERADALETRLKGVLKSRVEQIPDDLLRDLVEKMKPEEQAEWFEKNADKLTTIGATPERPTGSRPTGRPATPPRAEADKEAREGQRRARVSAI